MLDDSTFHSQKIVETDVEKILEIFKLMNCSDDISKLRQEIESIYNATCSSDKFRVLLHGDICPDNVFYQKQEIRLFDFEYADVGHALIDGAYLRMGMPSLAYHIAMAIA